LPEPDRLASVVRETAAVISATGYGSAASDLVRSVIDDPLMVGDRLCTDEHGRVVGAGGHPIDGLYALGLGVVTIPRPVVRGGEASFTGAVDGVWYYQRVLAAAISSHIRTQ
jgi:hypothetical protein